MQLLGRYIRVPCVLFLCRDNVAIEVPFSRPRRSRQVLRCCNRFSVGQGFYVEIEFGKGQGISCRDREFLCHERVS